MRTVAIIGGGAFGTALAQLCAERGQQVRLWARREAVAQGINRGHTNPEYLSEFRLLPSISASTDRSACLAGADWVVVAVPSNAMRVTLTVLAPSLPAVPIVIATKGLEVDSFMTMPEVAIDVLGSDCERRILLLSGPSFAHEMMQHHPTAVVLACPDEALADRIGQVLFCDSFRAYSTTDVAGVAFGGSLKNVMAIAAGGIKGMGFGDNTRAALVTRGVAEITRLAVAKGANPLTLAGLAGVGDVLLTCTGELSRNRALGQALGEGLTLSAALQRVGLAEGVETARAAKGLADKLAVEARIIRAVYRVLYEGQPAGEALLGLVRRAPGREQEFDR